MLALTLDVLRRQRDLQVLRPRDGSWGRDKLT